MAMSPPPLVKCSETGLLVHAPLTLSDTCTCPGASYCANQPTRRCPAATGDVSVNVAVVALVPGEFPAPWTKAGEAVGVVTWTGEDSAEWFPAPSKASTV